MKKYICGCFSALLVLLAALLALGCPVDDDHPDVGSWATITFDTGDSAFAHLPVANRPLIPRSTTIRAVAGDSMERLPSPFWQNIDGTVFYFHGWYTNPCDFIGERIEEPFLIEGDIVMYAWWGDIDVKLDATAGGYPDASVLGLDYLTRAVRRPPWFMSDLPGSVNGTTGLPFLGWHHGANILFTTETDANTIAPDAEGYRVLFARFGTTPGPSGGFAVTFNPTGGGWPDGTSTRIINVTNPGDFTINGAGGLPPDPVREGWTFVSWRFGGTRWSHSMIGNHFVHGEIEFTAEWR